MIEIKSSKKCCKCFREENALLHLIWILLCSIESSPSLSYEESAGWDGGAAEHVVLVTDCSTAAAPGPGQWRACSGVAVLQQGSLQPYYDTTTTAATLPTLCRSLPCSRGGFAVLWFGHWCISIFSIFGEGFFRLHRTYTNRQIGLQCSLKPSVNEGRSLQTSVSISGRNTMFKCQFVIVSW